MFSRIFVGALLSISGTIPILPELFASRTPCVVLWPD
jgi:hypothetical protein